MTLTTHTDQVLVLGASGRLGRLVMPLLRDDDRFVAVYRSDPPKGGIRWSPDEPTEALPKVTAILALWGITPHPDKDLADNTTLAKHAMALGKSLGADRVIHCSSAAVYGAKTDARETGGPDETTHPYGVAKFEMEHAIEAMVSNDPSLPVPVSLRIANVSGADSLFTALDRGTEMTVDQFADGGGPLRSYVSPKAFVQCCLDLLAMPASALPRVLNIAQQPPIDMADIVTAAGRSMARKPAPQGVIQNVALNTDRLQSILSKPLAPATPQGLVDEWKNGKTPAK